MTNKYWLFRYFYTERWNRYSPTFYLWKQFEDLATAWIIWLNDTVIPENRYTWEIAPWIKTMRRFISANFDDTKLTEVDFNWIVGNVSSMNDIVLFNTPAEAITWIKANTDLIELTPWVFEIQPAWTDQITGKPTKQVTLTIN